MLNAKITHEKLLNLGKELGQELLIQMCTYCGLISYDEMEYWMTEMNWK